MTSTDSQYSAKSRQLGMLFDNSVSTTAFNIVVAIGLTFLLQDNIDTEALFTWTGSVVVINITRFLLGIYVERRELVVKAPPMATLIYLSGLAASGLIWGLSIWLLAHDTQPFVQAVMLAVLAGMIAGGAFLNAIWFVACAIYVSILTVPLIAWFAMHPDSHGPEIALAVLLYAGAILLFAYKYSRYFIQSLDLLNRNQDLIVDLSKEIERRGQLEAAAHQSEERFRRLIETAPDAIVVVDSNGVIVLVNDEANKMFGYGASELLGEKVEKLIPVRYMHSHEAVRTSFISAPTPRRRLSGKDRDLMGIRKDGSEFVAEVGLSPVETNEGRFVYASIRDMSVHRHVDELQREVQERQRAEQQLMEAQRIARIGNWTWHIDTGSVEWSDEVYRIFGLDMDEFEPDFDKFQQTIYPDDREFVNTSLEHCLATGDKYDIEFRICLPDEEVRHVHAVGETASDSGGDSHLMQGTVQDVTERVSMEQSLRESEERFNLAIQGANDGLWDWDLVTNGVYFSPRWKGMLGYADDELANEFETWQERVHPDDLPGALQSIDDYLQGRLDSFSIEFRMRHKDGHYVDILSRGVVRQDAQGKPVRFAGTHVDISESKRREAQEQGRSLMFEKMAASATLAGMLHTLLEYIISVEPEMSCSVLLISPDGRHLRHGVSIGLPDFYNEAIDGLEIGPGVGSCGAAAYTGERVIVDDIQTHPYWKTFRELAQRAGLGSCWSEPVMSSDGRVLGTFALYYSQARSPDASEIALISDGAHLASLAIERVEMEKKHATLQHQLQQAQKMESIGQLTGGIAHDFNNMLAAILGYTNLSKAVVEKGQTEKLMDYLVQVEQAGTRARDLVKQMLTFSRAERGTPEHLALKPLLKEIGTMLRPVLPSTINLNIKADHDISVMADPVQMHQMVMNLCVNARDAMHGKGDLSVEILPLSHKKATCTSCHQLFEGEFIELRIEDSGEGMDKELLGRVFEPFMTTKEVGKGTGMGLSMVHGLIHEHDGHIIVESEKGRGSVFRLLLPAASGDEKQEDSLIDWVAEKEYNVFIIDDDASMLTFLQQQLEDHGYQVNTFQNPHNALRTFGADPGTVDLVIVDQHMPGLKGDEVARIMLERKHGLPVILCSGDGEAITMEQAEAMGIKAFLKKPFDLAQLFHLAEQLLGEKIHDA